VTFYYGVDSRAGTKSLPAFHEITARNANFHTTRKPIIPSLKTGKLTKKDTRYFP